MNNLSLDKYDLEYFDPINISKKIEEDYERYLYSSFPLRNEEFFEKFKEEIKENHPYTKNKLFLEYHHRYKSGKFLNEIIIKDLVLNDIRRRSFLLNPKPVSDPQPHFQLPGGGYCFR